jgi:hypothetical protein
MSGLSLTRAAERSRVARPKDPKPTSATLVQLARFMRAPGSFRDGLVTDPSSYYQTVLEHKWRLVFFLKGWAVQSLGGAVNTRVLCSLVATWLVFSQLSILPLVPLRSSRLGVKSESSLLQRGLARTCWIDMQCRNSLKWVRRSRFRSRCRSAEEANDNSI